MEVDMSRYNPEESYTRSINQGLSAAKALEDSWFSLRKTLDEVSISLSKVLGMTVTADIELSSEDHCWGCDDEDPTVHHSLLVRCERKDEDVVEVVETVIGYIHTRANKMVDLCNLGTTNQLKQKGFHSDTYCTHILRLLGDVDTGAALIKFVRDMLPQYCSHHSEDSKYKAKGCCCKDGLRCNSCNMHDPVEKDKNPPLSKWAKDTLVDALEETVRWIEDLAERGDIEKPLVRLEKLRLVLASCKD
jgi:hypothetical protein